MLSLNKSRAGIPILPPTYVFKPAKRVISATIVVTVLLPFEPETAIIGACAFWQNNSISPNTGILFSIDNLILLLSSDTPGLKII